MACSKVLDLNKLSLTEEEEWPETSGEGIGPFEGLADEMYAKILAWLTVRELVEVRMVSSKWRDVVDNFFEFAVSLHEDNTDVERVARMRVKELTIFRLLNRQLVMLFPNLLKRLSIVGPINASSFEGLMREAAELQFLSVTKSVLMEPGLFGERREEGMIKIKELILRGSVCDCSDTEGAGVVVRNTTNLLSYELPYLSKMTFTYRCSQVSGLDQIAVALMNFLSRHTNLQEIIAAIVPKVTTDAEAGEAVPSPAVEISERVATGLKQVMLTTMKVTTRTQDLAIWITLLHHQVKLEELRIWVNEQNAQMDRVNEGGILFELVRSPLSNNTRTLTSVELKGIRLSPMDGSRHIAVPLDASVFFDAACLKILMIHRKPADQRLYLEDQNHPNIVNLAMMPNAIEKLDLQGFSCKSEELRSLVDVLQNLKTITLKDTGRHELMGVRVGVMQSITRKSKICIMDLSPVNSGTPSEVQELEALKSKLGMQFTTRAFFDFERFRNGTAQRPTTTSSSNSRPTSPMFPLRHPRDLRPPRGIRARQEPSRNGYNLRNRDLS